ncbi:MAG: hypothetical protein FWF81_09330 [Defluviitaleaceae bacterium]|nr:hypothetical protein [Defluviitaleaceae bacterium]
MSKLPSDTMLMARAQNKKYKSPFKDNRTTLFNVEAAKDKSAPHEYTRETYAPINSKSNKVVG